MESLAATQDKAPLETNARRRLLLRVFMTVLVAFVIGWTLKQIVSSMDKRTGIWRT